MNHFEKLYEEHEDVKVRFVGFTTEEGRYDFGVIYTNMFFGKPLVVCMQTGRSSILGADDVMNSDHLQKTFQIKCSNEAHRLGEFFSDLLPSPSLDMQYE